MMGLRDDLEIMRRHQENGTLKEHMLGEAEPLPPEQNPMDPSARPIGSTYHFIVVRGD